MSAPLHHLARLLLAQATNELAADERAELPTYLAQGRQALQAAVHTYYRPSAVPEAQHMVEQMVADLLRKECCMHTLRQHVSLAEALGLAQASKVEEQGCGHSS